MKNVSRILASAALAVTFSLATYAQTPVTPTATPSAQEVQAKADLYKKFLDNRSGKLPSGQPDPAAQKVAYEAGKEYLSKYSGDTVEADVKIVAYIQKWVTNYEKAVTEFQSSAAFEDAKKTNNYAKVYELGRPMLSKQPDNFPVLLDLVKAGFSSAQTNNKALNSDAINYTRQAIQLVESGNVTDLKSKDETLGYLYFALGFLQRDTSSSDAATAFLKAAQTTGTYKTFPGVYSQLGFLYFNGEYKKLAQDYTTNYNGKEKTPESEAAYERLNQVLDRTIDAYARAVALSSATDAKTVESKKSLMTNLTALYKTRHDNSEAGLNDLIAGVLAKPLPNPSEEVIPTPKPLVTSTPATGTPPATDGTMNTTKPATPPGSTPPATAKPTPKPGTVPPATMQKPVSKNIGAGTQSAPGKGRQ